MYVLGGAARAHSPARYEMTYMALCVCVHKRMSGQAFAIPLDLPYPGLRKALART